MKTLTRNAYAKVNLALDVLRRREDGYHDVCMIMQNLSLYDTLTFTVEEADTLTITLACDKAFVPCDARNLIYKAIALMGETYHLTGHVHVELVKRIPVEAGMAGGSVRRRQKQFSQKRRKIFFCRRQSERRKRDRCFRILGKTG